MADNSPEEKSGSPKPPVIHKRDNGYNKTENSSAAQKKLNIKESSVDKYCD